MPTDSPARPQLLIAARFMPSEIERLAGLYTLHRLDTVAPEDREAFLAEVGPRCDAVVCVGSTRVDAAFLAKVPNVRLVACGSVGYDGLDVAALSAAGVRLTHTPDVLTDDVADTALLLMLAARRRLLAGDAHVRSGAWGREGPMPLTAAAAGKRVGILGLGRIGSAIAARMAALGMEVGYFSRSAKPESGYAHFPTPLALAGWADVLVAATPGGAGTAGMVSAEVIAALGPQGCFVNIARGSVVDEPALIAALQDGRLGAAGLDVFLNEPRPDPAFATLGNVVLYPHHASGTVETRAAMSQLVVDNLAAHFAGKPLLTPVN